MATFANRELTELNISTLVYMLDTNIRIDPNKLVTIFKDIEPIPYNNPIDGVIKISVRGETKGLCKKLVFRRSYTQSSQVKNFRNQVSFYVRIIDEMPIYISKVPFDMAIGFFPKNKGCEQMIGKDLYRFRKGQTAFQFKRIKIGFDEDIQIGHKLTLLTSVTRKSQESELQHIQYELTEDDVNNGYTYFHFPNGCYAHTLYIDSDKEIIVDIDFVVEVNMFMFTSGKIKIAGCTQEAQIDKAMNVLMNYMEDNLGKNTMKELFGRDKDDFQIIGKNPVMINSDFAGNYEIKRYELDALIRRKYNILSSFEPCTHPAVIIKYYHNASYSDGNGCCLCPEYYGEPHKCSGKGNGKVAGECKTVTILVFQSGKVILTGGRHLDQVNSGYKFIQNVLRENEKELRRV